MNTLDWLPYAILAPLLMTVINFGDKYVVETQIPYPRAVLFFFAWINLLYATVFWLLMGAPLLPPSLALAFMLGGAMIIWANIFYFAAVVREETSRIIVLVQMQPVFILLLAWFFLGESITTQQFIGFALILIAATGVSMERRPQADATSIAGPMNRSFWLMLLASMGWSVGVVISDGAVSAYVVDWRTLFVSVAYTSTGYFLGGMTLYLLMPGMRRSVAKAWRGMRWRAFGALAFVETVFVTRQFAVFMALLLGPAALLGVLSSTHVFFGIVLGWLLTLLAPGVFKENITRADLTRKALWASVVFVGILLVGQA